MDFRNRDRILLTKRLARDVRERLDAAGARDVAFDEHWVCFSPMPTGEHELSCLIPLGSCVLLPLKALEGRADGDPGKLLEQFAADLAAALPNVRRASAMLRRYIAGVRRAAIKEVEAARAAGLDLQLADVAPKPTYAWHMAHPSWREAAYHVLAQVAVRRLDLALRSTIDRFTVEEAADVAAAVLERVEEQIERQARRAELRARGADLEVDEVTIRILTHFGLETAALLRRVEADQIVDATVHEDGRPGRVILISSAGRVESTLELNDGRRWTRDRLEIATSQLDASNRPSPGQPVGRVAGLPIFRDLLVTGIEDIEGAGVTLVHVHTPLLLFDGLSGSTWADERLAA